MDDKYLFKIKPKYHFLTTMIPESISLYLLFIVWCFGAGMGLSDFSVFLGFMLALVPWIVLFVSPYMTYLSYKQTVYIFYKDHLEYKEGFLTQNLKSLPQEKMVSVYLKKSVFQRMYDVGTIQVEVHSGESISLKDVEQPQKIYDCLKEIYKL